jgi:lipopolysaccharide/colanic/teichoic acid biosynthesis glycosyltransferase
MAKRLFDIVFSLVGLVLLSPVLLLSGLGIVLTSRGPILYRARRAGRNGDEFTMHKFRTMHHSKGGKSSAITAARDCRVFALGALLRRLKLDELPQLFDILRGKMSFVGPRPEDPRIVANHYTTAQLETLRVRPGLASPGSIYNYTHGDRYLDTDDPEWAYTQRLLPVKLALELVYVRRASFLYDLRIIARTLCIIVLIAMGKRQFYDPPEMQQALRLMPDSDALVTQATSSPATGRCA